MRRRAFLETILTGAAALGAGAAPFAFSRLLAPDAPAGFRTHLRPPGALPDEDRFVEACIGCGLCGEVCPVGAIKFFTREGGGRVNTPYINPEVKACTLSLECTKICPTNALTPVKREDVKMGIAQIDRAACYPWVDRGVCGACVNVCPLGNKAIKFSFANFYRPVVLDACVGCGQCVEVCPEPSLPIRIVHPSLGTVAKHAVS